MILATLSYPFGQDYVFPRTRLIGFCFVWWTPTSILSTGNPSSYLEAPFGGNTMIVKLKDWVWEWSTKTVQIDDFLEDLYMLPPGSSTPTSPGVCEVYGQWSNTARGWFLTVANAPILQTRWYNVMPAHPPGYYNPPFPADISYPFSQAGVPP